MAATRLHVGGLGERVKEEDLRNTFSHLGTIQTIEIIRTKGRSFAYINFLPSSENSLAKLFSTYNGCLWKGGKLKLEKAKEHYMDRLKQEWAEDAELVNSEDTDQIDVDENMAAPLKPKSTLDLDKMQLRLFFPKLRKVKSLPFRGTGKHKYSFQRVEVPPLPVHFCDCPEHCDDTQIDKINDKGINDKEINMMNSVMNKILNKKSSLKSGCHQPTRRAQVQDSKIQDDGINDEEIHVMNSVMKKLLDREIVNTEQEDLHNSPQITAPTSELQENQNEIDEETDDDDDIKINTGAGQDFEFESWELQTCLLNKMARLNEQRTTVEPAKNKLDAQNRKANSSNKKRKSVSIASNGKDPASPTHRKKVHFQFQSKESEENLEFKSVTESETKKLITSGMGSQKSSCKELVDDNNSGSCHLSHVTHCGDTNPDEQLMHGEETSTDNKKHNDIGNVVNEEHKPSSVTLSDSKELESAGNSVSENLDGSSQSKNSEGLQAAQSVEPSASSAKATRGSCWMQKQPWTQLVGGGKSSSFSISQILSGDSVKKQQLNKQNDNVTLPSFFGVSAFGGSQISKSAFAGEAKKKDSQASAARDTHLSKAPKDDHSDKSDSIIPKKSDSKQKVFNPLPGVRISETCPFMRTTDSLKDWQTAKTTLTSTHRKRNSNKQGFSS